MEKCGFATLLDDYLPRASAHADLQFHLRPDFRLFLEQCISPSIMQENAETICEPWHVATY